jgi:hypothetical protein
MRIVDGVAGVADQIGKVGTLPSSRTLGAGSGPADRDLCAIRLLGVQVLFATLAVR